MTPKVMLISICTTDTHASTCNHEHTYTHTCIYMQNPFLGYNFINVHFKKNSTFKERRNKQPYFVLTVLARSPILCQIDHALGH